MSSDPTEKCLYTEASLRDILEGHPILDVANNLGAYLKTGCDIVALIVFLWRAAARLGLPLNLELISDSHVADGLITDRLLNILPDSIFYANTIKDIHDLRTADFHNCEVIVIDRQQENMLRRACEVTNRDICAGRRVPGVYSIADHRALPLSVGPTISIITNQTIRQLGGIGLLYTTADDTEQEKLKEPLHNLLDKIGHCNSFSCDFGQSIRAALRPEEMLVAYRLMVAIAGIRTIWTEVEGEDTASKAYQCTVEDYVVARTLLTKLPLAPLHCRVSPHALRFANELYEKIEKDESYQKTLPDFSKLGKKLFTREVARVRTQVSYSTARTYLDALEKEGVVKSLRPPQKRGQGREIFYLFPEGRGPPSVFQNPYEKLPSVEKISQDCSSAAQL